MDSLSKPKDKWKVGKRLMELQREFPHDRVLERMIKEEFGKNQAFRYPAEYDVLSKKEDEKLKNFNDGAKQSQEASEYGSVKLEGFKNHDKGVLAASKRKQALEQRAKLAFEKDLVQLAQSYVVKASNRLTEEGNRVTLRQSLADIYQRLLKTHEAYVKANFRLLSYGQNEESETFKKSYPDSFQRYFFRYVKAISDKRGSKMGLQQIKRRFKKLPTAFLVSGSAQRCTMHDQVSCP